MPGTLTGAAATEALQFYAGMGALGLRFNASKVDSAVRTRSGRALLARALGACRWAYQATTPRHSPSAVPRSRCRASRSTAQRRARCPSRAASGDPHPPGLAATPESLSAAPARGGRA